METNLIVLPFRKFLNVIVRLFFSFIIGMIFSIFVYSLTKIYFFAASAGVMLVLVLFSFLSMFIALVPSILYVLFKGNKMAVLMSAIIFVIVDKFLDEGTRAWENQFHHNMVISSILLLTVICLQSIFIVLAFLRKDFAYK